MLCIIHLLIILLYKNSILYLPNDQRTEDEKLTALIFSWFKKEVNRTFAKQNLYLCLSWKCARLGLFLFLYINIVFTKCYFLYHFKFIFINNLNFKELIKWEETEYYSMLLFSERNLTCKGDLYIFTASISCSSVYPCIILLPSWVLSQHIWAVRKLKLFNEFI